MADAAVATPGPAGKGGGGGVYNADEAGKKLAELDSLVPQVDVPLHQAKFQQVQTFLKKNNELIVGVMARQREALEQDQTPGGVVDKQILQQCAEMIKELNDNLTQVYDIYAELSPRPKEEN